MGQLPKVPKLMGDSRVSPPVWERGCHLHTLLQPTPLFVPIHALPGFFPCSYFKRTLPSRRALWPCWVCFQCLLKDNAQMGALVGGLGWAAGWLIQAGNPVLPAGSLETSCFGF